MLAEDIADNRKKKTKSFALDENLVERLEKLSKRGDYGSQSSIVSVALYEFFSKHGVIAEGREVENIIKEFMQGEEGEALIRSILRKSLTANEEKSAATPVIEKQ